MILLLRLGIILEQPLLIVKVIIECDRCLMHRGPTIERTHLEGVVEIGKVRTDPHLVLGVVLLHQRDVATNRLVVKLRFLVQLPAVTVLLKFLRFEECKHLLLLLFGFILLLTCA